MQPKKKMEGGKGETNKGVSGARDHVNDLSFPTIL